jgi:MFS transporter, OFA family, oxalate/formate antiporter
LRLGELLQGSLRAKIALATLSLLFFIITAATFTSLGVVLPAMVTELKWSWADAGLGFTLLSVACGLASYAPTVMIRRFGVRSTLFAGAVVLTAGMLCLYVAEAVATYLIGATLAGIGFALAATIPGTFVLARSFERPATAFGVYFTVGGLGGAAGPLLAKLGVEHAWRDYWLAMAVAIVVLGVLAAFSIDSRLDDDARATDAGPDTSPTAGRDWTVAEALRTPQFWMIVAAYTAYLLLGVTVNYASVAHLSQQGVAVGVAAALLSLDNLLNALARSAGGVLSEWLQPKRLVVAALALMVVGTGALAVAKDLPMMLTYAVCVGVGYGLSYTATALLLLNSFGRKRNLELFSIMCLVSTLAAIGPYVGGAARDSLGSFGPALWLFAGVAAVVMIAIALMPPPKHTG